MNFSLSPNSPNFLGGSSVHGLVQLALAGFIVYKLANK